MANLRLLPAVFPAALLLACSSGGSSGTAATTGSGGATTSATSGAGGSDAGPIGGSRPVTMFVPPTYTPGTAVPLVMMLHGYSASSSLEESYLNIRAQSDAKGFIYAMPDGLTDPLGNEYWNATDACCDLYANPVDDSAYLSSVLTEIQARYTIDPKQVYLIGHSNGAFMSHRMACDHADQIAAIVSLAGAQWNDVTKCQPSQAVSVLEIHGTADMTIAFGGGVIEQVSTAMVPYPGALTTISDWVTLDGCTNDPDTSAPPLDLEASIPGAETTVTKYATGCKTGGHVELWEMMGGGHIPNITASFTPDAIQFLLDHPRP